MKLGANLTNTGSAPDAAYAEVCHNLAQLDITGRDIDNMFIESAIHSADKLDVWADLIERKGYGEFNAQDIHLQNSLLSRATRSTSLAVVVSSLLCDDSPGKIATKSEMPDRLGNSEKWGEFTKYTLNSGLKATFMKESYGASEGGYKNRFDFMSLRPAQAGEYVDYIALPYQSIDHRICSALSECNLMDEFSERLESLIGMVGHDFVHATLKSSSHQEISNTVNRTNEVRQGSIIGEELWALTTNSAIYKELKQHGHAQAITHETRGLMNVINSFEEKSASPEAKEMAASLRDVLTFHVSNFVKKETVKQAITGDKDETQLCKMLLKEKPGNTTSKIVIERQRHAPFGQDWLNHKKAHIFQLAADTFSAIKEVFSKDGDQGKLEQLKEAINARREEIGVSVDNVEQAKTSPRETGVEK